MCIYNFRTMEIKFKSKYIKSDYKASVFGDFVL